MTDVIALSELSDEPIAQPDGLGYAFSERLEAVWDRLPRTRQGQAARIRTWLARAGIDSVAKLVAMDRYAATGLGPASLAAIDAALACFGLHRVGQDPPLVVRDGATLAEVELQRLRAWLDKRLKAEISLGEREVLRDVQLVLDGQEAEEERHWPFPCRKRDDGDHKLRPSTRSDDAPAGSTICQSCGMVWS